MRGARGVSGSHGGLWALLLLVATVHPAEAGGDSKQRADNAGALPIAAAAGPVNVQTVIFADRRSAPVRVVRGLPRPTLPVRRAARFHRLPPAPATAPEPVSTQIVSFTDGTATRVTVIRGASFMPVSLVRRLDSLQPPRVETVKFTDPALPSVRIVRGPSMSQQFAVDLFAPANAGELDRVAFAVDGIESRHGTDLRMWRPEVSGPQGPMQISAAAAFDVGGGDRFDLRQNRMLGRAYLAQMFERYGNWVDALAAYNWGPGNVDQWIAGGHNPAQLPPEVIWYVSKALRDALILTAGR